MCHPSVTFPIRRALEGGNGKASRLIATDDQSAAIRLNCKVAFKDFSET